MDEGVLVGLDTGPAASANRTARETQDELAAKTQSATEQAVERIALLAAQKAAASRDSQALLEHRLAEASRESEREMRRLQAALGRCKAARERRML
jgi:hypothetical protein